MPYNMDQEVIVPSPSPCRMDERLDSEDKKTPPSSPRLSPQSVIVFDWDDTLLASSFLSSKGYKLDTVMEKDVEFEAQLKELENSVKAVLTLALSHGDVIIITNAETGWVELSAQKFIPGVAPLLSQVRVLSARSTYESMFPDSPLKWKFYAFQERLSSYLADARRQKNILSFGDSHVEREAVRSVTRGAANTLTKSVKFAERPSMEQLRRQIELVTNCFQYIHNHDGDLDLQLTVTVSHPNQSTESPSTPPSPTQTPVTSPSNFNSKNTATNSRPRANSRGLSNTERVMKKDPSSQARSTGLV